MHVYSFAYFAVNARVDACMPHCEGGRTSPSENACIVPASFISLQSIILVELIGLDMLTNAFMLMCLFKGTGCYIGPPLAG